MNNLLDRSKQFIGRNSATILTCIGGAGVVATAVMAVKATPKALQLCEQAEDEKGEELTKFEAVKAAGMVYIPTALMGTATIACIFGANVLNKRKQVALISAYALLDSSYKEYKEKVAELYGDEAPTKIKEEIAKDHYAEEDIDLADGKELFFDEFSGRYFESTIYDVRTAQYNINKDMAMKSAVSLNEYYSYLDIPPIDGGDELGWSSGGCFDMYWQSWIDFNHHRTVMDDGLECCIVGFFTEPFLGYDD